MATEQVDWKSVPHKAPVRPEPRVLLRVEMAGRGGMVAGQRIGPGVQHVICYRSELDGVKAACATRDQLETYALATRTHEAKLAAAIAAIKGNGESADRARARVRMSYPGSPESEYHAMRGEQSGDRGIPPLRRVEVLGDVPPPDSALTRQLASQDQLLALVQQIAQMPDAIGAGIRDGMLAVAQSQGAGQRKG